LKNILLYNKAGDAESVTLLYRKTRQTRESFGKIGG